MTACCKSCDCERCVTIAHIKAIKHNRWVNKQPRNLTMYPLTAEELREMDEMSREATQFMLRCTVVALLLAGSVFYAIEQHRSPSAPDVPKAEYDYNTYFGQG